MQSPYRLVHFHYTPLELGKGGSWDDRGENNRLYNLRGLFQILKFHKATLLLYKEYQIVSSKQVGYFRSFMDPWMAQVGPFPLALFLKYITGKDTQWLLFDEETHHSAVSDATRPSSLFCQR